MMQRARIAFLVIIISFSSCSVKYSSLISLSESDEKVSFEKVGGDTAFADNYLVWFEQPINHDNPSEGTFKQRVWLSHKAVDAPLVFVTEGYSAPAIYQSELAALLESNQIVVEHRFYGASVPAEIPWQHLTIEQAARDHHNIVEFFQQYYKSAWISTGISKGGQTAMIHRAFYPSEIDLTLTYVAPYNLEREDERLIDFFDKVGTREERDYIKAFQIEVLKRRENMLSYFRDWAEENGVSFKMGMEQAFELAVLEYPFSIRQWCVPIVPGSVSSASSRELFDQLYRGIDFRYFSTQESIATAPYFYQAYTQLGHYAYDASYLKQYLKYYNSDRVSSDILAPRLAGPLIYSGEAIKSVTYLLQKSDPRMIHIVGEKDPWSATTPDISGLKNTTLISDPEGCHLTRINTLPKELRDKVLGLIEHLLNKRR